MAGCDGHHGACRPAIPRAARHELVRVHPFAWFGILAQVPRLSPELIYALHERGFALASTRSEHLQRLYVQCDPHDRVEDWSDDRIWSELHAPPLDPRRIHVRGRPHRPEGRDRHAQLRGASRCSTAASTWRATPPTSSRPPAPRASTWRSSDVWVLARALAERYATGKTEKLDRYCAACLRRAWNAQRFSWRMTSLLHRFPEHDEFQRRLQLADLEEVARSRAAAISLAESYVGLPFEP